MKKRIAGILMCTLTAALLAAGCGKTDKEESKADPDKKEKIVIGTSSVSKDLAESGKAELEKKGYKVEIKIFNDYVLPNSALADESIDANIYQHEPYMNNYNDSNKTDIVMLSPKLYNYYSGLYSVKADSVETLPDGGKVGIAEDASNISEQLQQLEEAKVIKLSDKPSSGEFYTIADIVENPHNYEFPQGDQNKYKNMEEYACLIGTSNTMAEAGIDPTKNLLQKFVDEDLAIGMCVMEKNKDSKWTADLMEAYTSENARKNVPAASGFEPVQ